MDIHFDYRSYQDLQNIPRLRNFLLKEWIKSSVKRVVKLPESVESENAKSCCTKGVLECRLPKTQKSQVKVIPIT
ncbi:MAG: hypothetical protein CL894_03210 [Dehalococcoidia bacterium]|nr:hypothetical protein [Dehalococcoidia bacterium]